MSGAQSDLRWSNERRLEFLEFKLFWDGGVNRGDLISHFGVSVPQASKDLTQYQELHPNNTVYDKHKKRYVPTAAFTPAYLKPDPVGFLTRLAGQEAVGGESGPVLPVYAMPVPRRPIDASALRVIVEAVREKASVEILYQSMSAERPEPIWRRISPHAFGFDGFRWHVRAWCHISSSFKDFIISRIMGTRDLQPSLFDGADDSCWRKLVDVKLIPNPRLSPAQQSVIARDYDMRDGAATLRVRQAFLYYFNRHMGLDKPADDGDPRGTPVVVANRQAYDAALKQLGTR